jgi:hypothetical protein
MKFMKISVRIYFMVALFFYPEDGGDMFFRNVGISPIYTVLQPRRIHKISLGEAETQRL